MLHVALPALAIATEDFAVYHDMARYLKAQGVAFVTLPIDDPIPGEIGAVITTEAETERIEHVAVVAFTTPEGTYEEAILRLKGIDEVRSLIIGVDPGERPGIAVVADGQVLSARQIALPELVVKAVRKAMDRYHAPETIVRVGLGAPTIRDRIVNDLLRAGLDVEVVDERSTSVSKARLEGFRDAVAARSIAMTQGQRVIEPIEIDVTDGELRDIQRRSRLASDGELTISRELAHEVAVGDVSLAEAVRRQKAKAEADDDGA